MNLHLLGTRPQTGPSTSCGVEYSEPAESRSMKKRRSGDESVHLMKLVRVASADGWPFLTVGD